MTNDESPKSHFSSDDDLEETLTDLDGECFEMDSLSTEDRVVLVIVVLCWRCNFFLLSLCDDDG